MAMSATNRMARGFTLIELLVVITIIGLLAAILVPSIAGALKGAKKARAMAEVRDLDGAIKRFIGEYGKPPLPRGSKIGDADMECTDVAQADVIRILANWDDDWNSEERNTKQIVFLDLDPASFGVKTTLEIQAALANGPYKDPWGHSYGILLDMNLDDRIAVSPYGTTENPIRARSAVYSLGEGGEANREHPPYKTW